MALSALVGIVEGTWGLVTSCLCWVTFSPLCIPWLETWVRSEGLESHYWADFAPAENISVYLELVSVQFSSVAQSCPTLCDPMNCSKPGLPVHYQLPEFTQTHVHRVCDAIQGTSLAPPKCGRELVCWQRLPPPLSEAVLGLRWFCFL